MISKVILVWVGLCIGNVLSQLLKKKPNWEQATDRIVNQSVALGIVIYLLWSNSGNVS